MQGSAVGERVEVEILRWAHGGDAVAVPGQGGLEGRVVFVEDAVPGDRLQVEITEDRQRWGRARVVEILSQSPERRAARCEVQSRCGGCPWMLGGAEAQRRSREAILRGEVEKRLGARANKAALRLEATPEPGEFGYRQRVVLAFARGKDRVVIGFHGRGSHVLVDLPNAGCVVAKASLNAVLPEVRQALLELPVHAKGRVTLLAGENGVAGWVEVEGGQSFGVFEEAAEVRFGGFTQRLLPKAFAQANAGVTGQILEVLERFAREARGGGSGLALELFAGAGTLTMALWRAGWDVVAYEGDGAAREGFEATRTREGVTAERGLWHVADLGSGLPWPLPERAPGLVVLDPPRTGASALMPWLRGLRAPFLAYLSCDLATGLRDLRELVGTHDVPGPYDVREIIGFDMFPHSGHQEVLALLALRPT